jgi:hypothetical protein
MTVQISVNGRLIEPDPPWKEIEIPLDPRRCSVVRARVDEGYSGPIYANCGF